jgi:hypothetical protein
VTQEKSEYFRRHEKKGGRYEGKEQRNKGNQESPPVEPERKEKAEKGEEEQVTWQEEARRYGLPILGFLMPCSDKDFPQFQPGSWNLLSEPRSVVIRYREP